MIFSSNQSDNEEETDKKINNFISLLVKRKREDPFEGGLQACMVIFPDKFAMKICENDGSAPHVNSFINLVKYLNNDSKYISLIGTSYFGIYSKERRQLYENGIEVRILDGNETLMLAITSKTDINSSYQIEILGKILFFFKVLKDEKAYECVNVGLHTPSAKIDFNDLSEEHYKNVLNVLNNLDNKIKLQ